METKPHRRFLAWFGLGLTALLAAGPLLMEKGPVGFLSPEHVAWGANGVSIVAAAVVFVVGIRVYLDRGDSPASLWISMGLVLLATAMTAYHWHFVDQPPRRMAWQKDSYLKILGHTYAVPHNYRPLPYGFARRLERWTGDWSFSCLAYRWLFTFWFVWAAYRLARLVHCPGRALLTLLPLAVLYPFSVARYMGQLTDPLSHALFVLAFIYGFENRVGLLAATLALGVMAKETIVLVVPAFFVCYWRQGWRAWAATIGLGAACVAAFLLVRVPVGWLTAKNNINGLSRLMIGTNLGIGEPIALTKVSLLENYLHPIGFVVPFLPFIMWNWRMIDRRMKVLFAVVTPTLLFSNLCYGWLYESRNYMPLVPLLATLAVPRAADRKH